MHGCPYACIIPSHGLLGGRLSIHTLRLWDGSALVPVPWYLFQVIVYLYTSPTEHKLTHLLQCTLAPIRDRKDNLHVHVHVRIACHHPSTTNMGRLVSMLLEGFC